MSTIIFVWYLITGTIHSVDNVDGRTIYDMPSKNIEYAYKEEIIQYIETGTFKYDEDL